MNCERARERMMEWMDGRLEPAVATELKAHVDTCPGCQAELAAQRRMAEILDAPPSVQPTADLRRRVLADISREKSSEAEALASAERAANGRARARQAARGRSFGLLWQALGACALIAAGYVVGMRRGPSAPAAHGPETGSASRPATEQELADLRTQMSQLVGYTLQQQQSSSANQRLEGVISAAALRKPDQTAINQLIGSLVLDPSANVRLSAVQALYPHAGEDVVRTAIAVSLPREQSPIVQLAMIDFLTAAKDRDARPVLEKLSANPDADANVREAAQRALAQLPSASF